MRYAVPVRRLALLPLFTLALASTACKGGRTQLEQLVPDGATGLVSVDAGGLVKSELFTKVKTNLDSATDGKATAALNELRDGCKLDVDAIKSVVVGFDALSQNGMGAVHMPNLGKAEALRCVDELVKKQGGKGLWTVGESDGKATVTAENGKLEGWALDDDTLVLSTKGWASAVQARMKGESKGAIDNNLAEAVAMADRNKHVWLAGEVPALMQRFLDDGPAKGVRRAAGSLHYGDDLEIAIAAAFADEAGAKAVHDELAPMLEEFKKVAVGQGLSQKSADSVAIELDGAVLKGKVNLEMDPLFEVTNAAFSKYMSRSKTSEARVQLAKMFDATSAFFNEEHVSRGEIAVLGAGGSLGAAPHACPNDGKRAGETGPTPPLSVDCSKGPGGRCKPVSGEPSGPGEYSMRLWTDSPVWNALNFQMEDGHYFHYNFKWENSGDGFGQCQFTAQAFGDLDADATFSTYERAGAADENGVNAAAGLYIDNELE